MTFRIPNDLGRRSRCHDGPSLVTALGAEVDNMVSRGKDVQVVFNKQDRITLVDDLLQKDQQFPYIQVVEACGRLIQYVKRMPPELLPQFLCQLYSLGLPPAEGRRGLSEADVPKSCLLKHRKPPRYPRYIPEKGPGFIYGHFKNFGDVPALVPYIESFPVVPLPVADLALDVDIGHKEHGDPYFAVSLAGLTATPRTLKLKRPAL